MQHLDEVCRRLASSALNCRKHADLVFNSLFDGKPVLCSLSRISEEIESNFRLRSTRHKLPNVRRICADCRKFICFSAIIYHTTSRLNNRFFARVPSL